VATVNSMTIRNAVSGTGRTAASARLRLVGAPLPWMSEVGVCPTPVTPRIEIAAPAHRDEIRVDFARIDALRVDGGRIDARIEQAGLPVRSAGSALDQQSARQYAKHEPGSRNLRPPV
jgi:hypothetical protein